MPPIQARFSINILEDQHNEILLLKRSSQAQLGAGLWGFPAGHIIEGESPGQCSIREICEEIGLDHRIELLDTVAPVRDTRYGGVYEIHLFHYRWIDGRIVLNPEHTEHAWVNRDNYKCYPVVDGVDEDIDHFKIWPRSFLNQDKLPR